MQIIQLSEEKKSLASEVLKEFDQMENLRRENQYKDVLQAFRKNIKEGNGLQLSYNNIIYDEVRERLEKDGFKIRTVTANATYVRVMYLITRKEDFVPEIEDKE